MIFLGLKYFFRAVHENVQQFPAGRGGYEEETQWDGEKDSAGGFAARI